jgi:hypothetical protein
MHPLRRRFRSPRQTADGCAERVFGKRPGHVVAGSVHRAFNMGTSPLESHEVTRCHAGREPYLTKLQAKTRSR